MQLIKRISTLTILLLLIVGSAKAQDAYFSQFYANPVLLNPALAGSEGKARFIVAHRKQWTNISSYSTSSFSYDMPIGQTSGMAFQATNDIQMEGVIKQATAGLTFSHKLILDRNNMIGFGINANYYQKRFDWSTLVFEDQMRSGSENMYPTAERFGTNNSQFLDVGAGVTFNSDKLLVGLNVAHINKPSEQINPESETQLPMTYTMHLAYTLERYSFGKKTSYITPNVIYQRQGTSDYLNIGAYWSNDLLSLGAHYRINQAVIASAGIAFDQFSFGYSYDYFLASSETSFGATNEFTISYKFDLKKKVKRAYVAKCPDVYKNLK